MKTSGDLANCDAVESGLIQGMGNLSQTAPIVKIALLVNCTSPRRGCYNRKINQKKMLAFIRVGGASPKMP